LKVLEDAGLISTRVEGARRPRRLESAGIDAMDEWLGKLRKSLEMSYGRLDEVLAVMERASEIETESGTDKVKRKEKGGGKGKGKGKKKRKKEKHK
jgi:DNA-binding PadR family transcriptional regulator